LWDDSFNGRAIFHEKRARRSRQEIRTELQELKGNRRFRKSGTETRKL
jgi:hypothetical protein